MYIISFKAYKISFFFDKIFYDRIKRNTSKFEGLKVNN